MMRKMILMIFGLMLTLTACFEDCNKVTGPDLPPTEELVYYTIQVEYIRTEIRQWDLVDKFWGVVLTTAVRIAGGISESARLRKIDDYHYIGEFENKIPDNEKSGVLYAMYGVDDARWDRIDNGTAIVGDRFILTVKETGSVKELTNVVQNTLDINPAKTPSARMATMRLWKNGTITDK